MRLTLPLPRRDPNHRLLQRTAIQTLHFNILKTAWNYHKWNSHRSTEAKPEGTFFLLTPPTHTAPLYLLASGTSLQENSSLKVGSTDPQGSPRPFWEVNEVQLL